MKNIGGFFEKFRNKTTEQVRNLVFIIETIRKHTGITFEMKDISITAGILRIKTTPVKKSEIFIKKEGILKDIRENLKSVRIEDIR